MGRCIRHTGLPMNEPRVVFADETGYTYTEVAG